MKTAANIIDRLWKHISPEPMSGCWLWTGCLTKEGYGRFAKESAHPKKAHRISYEIYKGKIPDGLQIDHLCRVRCCVNPDHLEAVTRKENVRRGLRGVLKTHCANGHPWIQENKKLKTDGWFQCRICSLEKARAKYWRDKETVVN